MGIIIGIKWPRGLLSAEDKLKVDFSGINSQGHATGPQRAASSCVTKSLPATNPSS